MENVKNTSSVVSSSSRPQVSRPTLSSQRWTTRPSHPRLISFSWAAVRPMATQR